jgi:hypothetical protein
LAGLVSLNAVLVKDHHVSHDAFIERETSG